MYSKHDWTEGELITKDLIIVWKKELKMLIIER